MRQIPITACVLALFLGGVGCGGVSDRPKLIPVSGTVLLNGQPVKGATVRFFGPKAPRDARGVTDEDGKFSLSTFEAGDGTMPGDNVITVTKIDESSLPPAPASNIPSSDPLALASMASQMQNKQGDKGGPKYLVPKRYSDVSTTPLKEKIEPGEAPIVLQLTEG